MVVNKFLYTFSYLLDSSNSINTLLVLHILLYKHPAQSRNADRRHLNPSFLLSLKYAEHATKLYPRLIVVTGNHVEKALQVHLATKLC